MIDNISTFVMTLRFLFNTIEQKFEIQHATHGGEAISAKRQHIENINIMHLYQTAFMFCLLEKKFSKGNKMEKLLTDLER